MTAICPPIKTMAALCFFALVIGNCSDDGDDDETTEAATETAAGGTTTSQTPVPSTTVSLADATDDFSNPDTLSQWERVYQREGWGFSQLESFDINTTRSGWMTMMPYTSSWYGEYRGVLAFKQITGDFVVTTRVATTNRSGTGAPTGLYSLAGIMVRTPRDITPSTRPAGGENYIFLASGAADTPGTYQTEVKTTVGSQSTLEIEAGSSEMIIRVARYGGAFILLIADGGGAFRVHRRFSRGDMPEALQVGLTCYTDWSNVEALTPDVHNVTQITDGNPGLIAQFDYVNYESIALPENLSGLDLMDANQVSDAELLSFLGTLPGAP